MLADFAGALRSQPIPCRAACIQERSTGSPRSIGGCHAGTRSLLRGEHPECDYGNVRPPEDSDGNLQSSVAGMELRRTAALSTLLYPFGRYQNAKLSIWDMLRALIPSAAYTAWMLVQNPGVFDVW